MTANQWEMVRDHFIFTQDVKALPVESGSLSVRYDDKRKEVSIWDYSTEVVRRKVDSNIAFISTFHYLHTTDRHIREIRECLSLNGNMETIDIPYLENFSVEAIYKFSMMDAANRYTEKDMRNEKKRMQVLNLWWSICHYEKSFEAFLFVKNREAFKQLVYIAEPRQAALENSRMQNKH